MKGFFVTGIHTGIGKTVTSAVLSEAIRADYWKPVQSGGIAFTDSDFIREHTTHHPAIHPEAYLFKEPVSPHYAAMIEGKEIDIQKIGPVNSPNPIIIEGAGGVLSPLSDKFLIADLAKHLGLPVILVSMNYLGSINHTLMSIEAMLKRNIPVAGIIFNGMANPSSEEYILKYSGIKHLGSIPFTDRLSASFITEQAKKFEYLYELVG